MRFEAEVRIPVWLRSSVEEVDSEELIVDSQNAKRVSINYQL